MNDLINWARAHNACGEAIKWLRTQSDPETAWRMCERPDWLIWMAQRRGVDRKILVRIACDCARTALRFVPDGENRPRVAIETTECWLVGEATIEDVRKARAAAYADAAYADAAAAYAADAAAYAADAAAAAAYAAYAAAAYADAADAAAAAAYAAAAYAAADRREANIKMACIIRQSIAFADMWPPREEA